MSLTYVTFTAQWDGLSCVLAVDYDRYVIIKQCKYKSNKRKYLLPETFKCMTMWYKCFVHSYKLSNRLSTDNRTSVPSFVRSLTRIEHRSQNRKIFKILDNPYLFQILWEIFMLCSKVTRIIGILKEHTHTHTHTHTHKYIYIYIFMMKYRWILLRKEKFPNKFAEKIKKNALWVQ